jgi:DNA mismatch endonuclease, patch repair protein
VASAFKSPSACVWRSVRVPGPECNCGGPCEPLRMPETWVKTEWSSSLSGRRSRDTRPEQALRSALHRHGFRFRIHQRIPKSRLTVDILMPKYKIAVQVHGCFWHRHGCAVGGGRKPSGPNARAWASKIERVRESDKRGTVLLGEAGYQVVVVWECELRKDLDATVSHITKLARKSTENLKAYREGALDLPR